MNSRSVRLLLLRFILVPIVVLSLLAAALAYSAHKLSRLLKQVDTTDEVTLHSSNLLRLLVDEETGVRGYLINSDPKMLDPYRHAGPEIGREFDQILPLVGSDPRQVGEIQAIRDRYESWHSLNAELIKGSDRNATQQGVLAQKQGLDSLRSQVDSFARMQIVARRDRDSAAVRWDGTGSYLRVGSAALSALLIIWASLANLHQLTRIFKLQLDEVDASRRRAFEREQWLDVTLRSIGDAVIACDAEGRIVFMNAVAELLTGWNERDASERTLQEIFKIVNETTRAIVESPVDKVRRLGTVVGLANHTILIRRDGTEVSIDDSGAPIRDAQAQISGVVLVFRDISERRQSENALIRAEKLASAGRLSAAIAHEVNNPLEALTNLIFLARLQEKDQQIAGLLTQAELEVSRISHITRQSLGFYRESQNAESFSLANAIHNTVAFYTARATIKQVAVETRIKSDTVVVGSPGEIRQVLSNLLANSLDATPAGGKICIKLNKVRRGRTPQEVLAVLTVADTGSGIAPEHMSTIFEPFFSTKGEIGTGLGLWVTRQLIEKHGGTIRLKSSFGQPKTWTVFQICIPALAPVVDSD
jgi:PAS domain S-box-containing protein